jgi:DASH complex subunit ASK1
MHKHFRMIAISEHLRNHGFDPDFLPHTRIPGIWAKLRTYYNMEAIDERENNIDYIDDENFDRRFLDFDLPFAEFGEEILSRARADPSEAPTSPAQWEPEDEQPSGKKRKRGTDTPAMSSSAGPKTRDSTVDDTEGETPVRSPAPRTARGARSSKRAASKARKAKEESAEVEASGEEEEEDDDEEEEEEEEEEGEKEEEAGDAEEGSEEEESGTPASKSARGGARSRGKARTRGRGRARGRGS